MMRVSQLGVLTLASVFVLSACSSTAPGTGSPTSNDPSSNGAAPETSDTDNEVSEDEGGEERYLYSQAQRDFYAQSPLTPYLLHISPEISEADYIATRTAEIERREATLVTCMSAAGFEYFAEPASFSQIGPDDEGIERGTREYVQKNGYGLFAPLKHRPEPEASENDVYFDSLSDEDKIAFENAMYGEYGGPTDQVSCWDEADTAARGDRSWEQEFEALNSARQLLVFDEEDDPRTVALNDRWAQCMTTAGFDEAADPSQSRMQFGMKYTSFQDLWHQRDSAEIVQLIEDEIKQALADWDCKQEVDYDAELRKVRLDLEQQFVDANKEQLDAYLAAAQANGAR